MKDTFIMRKENMVSIERMSDADAGALFKAILAHANGVEIDLDESPLAVQLLFPLIAAQIDRADKAYQETCERRAEAGRAGGLAKASNSKQSQANDSKAKHSEPEPEYDIEPEDEKRKAPTEPKEKVRLKAGFDEAWAAYPRKHGRKQAEAAYQRAVKSGTRHEDILAGIEAYKEYLAREKIGEQYVKQGSSFFNQAAWADDWGPRKGVAVSKDPPANPLYAQDRQMRDDQEQFKTSLSEIDFRKLLWKEASG